MFFATFWTWLNSTLAGYVGAKTTVVAAAIEPAVVTLATIYIMLWGYASLTGKIQEPVLEFGKRFLIIAVILGISIKLWYYNTVIVDTFVNSPMQLAAVVVGSSNPMTIIDKIWSDGGAAAGELWKQGGVFSGDVGFYIAGGTVYLIIGLLCIYAFFLMTLSAVALSIILGLGPIFLSLLFFDATKRFFESWMAQLANYALISILVAMVSALFLTLVQKTTAQIAALGSSVTFFATLEMLLAAVLVFLVLKQVPAIAAGLASGIALSSFGAISSALRWAGGGAGRSLYQSGRGLIDGLKGEKRSRWDSMRRSGGNLIGQGIRRGAQAAFGSSQKKGGTVSRDSVMPRPNR
ncbi:type IV secretion system protein [Denitromonas iodatirespirans]|uniref:Type IV secretion system protein n=1 Tax=Denitromonas iodatirespirans TaxID=2795389 RepID=A0A944H991_DENI1|nr:type IV secretion system protein [Denitromonas iodatirespirans]MBT0963009.1 type IV secretion system protein [Denitromonas iodatirespirans]